MKSIEPVRVATRATGLVCSSSSSSQLSPSLCLARPSTITTSILTTPRRQRSHHYHSCYSFIPTTSATANSSPKSLDSRQHNVISLSRAYSRRPIFSSTPNRHQSSMAQSRPEPAWSEGTDTAIAQPQLDALLVAAQGGSNQGKWTLRSDGAALERAVAFKTFKATWAFMDAVAGQCKKARHHPEWANVYSRVWIRWTTHSPAGLSQKDLDMAAKCDELAAAEGELAGDTSDNAVLQQAADTVAAVGADCCVPRSKH